MQQKKKQWIEILIKLLAIGGNWCQIHVLNYTKKHFLTLIELTVTCVFSLTAFYYTQKFSPLDVRVPPILHTEVMIDPQSEAIFTTNPLNLQLLKDEISGSIKQLYVGTVNNQIGQPNLYLNSLEVEGEVFSTPHIINFGSNELQSEIDKYIAHIKENVKRSSTDLFVMDGVRPVSNVMVVIAKDYIGNYEFIYYIAYLDYYKEQTDTKFIWATLKFIPIRGNIIGNREQIKKLYHSIDFGRDPFWQPYDINEPDELLFYIINIKDVVIKEFNKTE